MAGFKIVWIGAGKMGLPVCQRLKAAGHDLRIFARGPEQAVKLRNLGLDAEGSLTRLIEGAGIIFTCVPDDQASAM